MAFYSRSTKSVARLFIEQWRNVNVYSILEVCATAGAKLGEHVAAALCAYTLGPV